MSDDLSPVEQFKEATSATLRSIAERDDIDVAFSNEPSGITGTRARVPFPSRDLPPEEVAQVRGEADGIALRLRHHDAETHVRNMPTGDVAPLMFEALEQARVEAIGARRMVGLSENLASAMETRYRQQGLHRVKERTEATLPEAVRLLAREQLTGAPPPPSGQAVYDHWKPVLEDKIGRALENLESHINDQKSYGEAVRNLLTDLDIDLGAESNSDEMDGSDDEGDNADSQPDQDEEGGELSGEGEAMSEAMMGEAGDDDMGDSVPDDQLGETMPMTGSEEPGDPGTPWRPENDLSNIPKEPFYKSYTEQFDEVVLAETLCDTEELGRLRQ